MMLMHSFGTCTTLVQGHETLQLLIRYHVYIIIAPGRCIVTEKIQPCVDCEMVTNIVQHICYLITCLSYLAQVVLLYFQILLICH